ncbi:PAS domain-containing protein [Cereibacter sphaeroides]|uniref:PAS domain-containing hybrid sensor histidine kinase/response regulator n=1 Tax=Cereibacter sphaeroides TaxID=1063 RepID=UPI003FCC870C
MMPAWAARLGASRDQQRALEEERSRTQAALQVMPHMLIELDADERLLRGHPGWLDRLPTLGPMAPGQGLQDFLPADLATEVRRVLAEVETTGAPVSRDWQVRQAGARVWLAISAARLPPLAPDRRPGHAVMICDTTELHAQRKQADRLGKFAQLTTNLVIVTDPHQRIEWVNAAFEQQTGHPGQTVRGQPLCAVLQGEPAPGGCGDRLRAMLAEGRTARAEVEATAACGRRFWLDVSLQPLLDDEGALDGYMAVASDITAHKRQEEQLAAMAAEARATRARLAAAVDVLPDGFAYFDAEDRLVVFNPQYRDCYPGAAAAIVPGASFEQILRQAVQSGDILEARGREEEWLAARLAAHHRGSNQQEQQLADGRWLRVIERQTPDGGRVGLRVDVTALKLAEQRTRIDFSATMDASQDGIAFTDPEGRYIYMNPAHREMFGIATEDEILGRSWRELYSGDVADHIATTALPALLSTGGWRGELIGRRRDGSELPQEVSLTLKADGGIICISRDISRRLREQQERMRLREELQMAQRREVIGQLASGLAHDLNNLLAAIGGSALLIQEMQSGAAEVHAQRILAATEQAGALVRRFLTLGKRQSNRSRIDLCPLLQEAADLVQAGLHNRTRLTLALPDAPIWIEADPTDILQVVLNLVINARDAISTAPPREGGHEITVALAPAGPAQLVQTYAVGAPCADRRYVSMTVSDSGPGIEPAMQAKVFQPYFSTKGAAGTGLGLAIVTGVLTANHGAIALQSAPGEGTRFTVLWPVEPPDAAAPSDKPAPHFALPAIAEPAASAQTFALPAAAEPAPGPEMRPAGRLAGRTILVADDNADVLRVLVAFLEGAGAEVVPCSDPRDALAALQDDPRIWDLLVTDYDMPQISGADLCRAANDLAPDLPVLLITALPDWRSRISAAAPRFTAELGKPLGRATLLEAAERAIGAKAG